MDSNIAALLAAAGFQGVFISSPSLGSVALPEKSQSAVREYSSPWPNLENQGTTELVFPSRLEARSPSSFTIWSPGPTIQPLMSLLRSYTELRPDIPDIVSFLHLWTRSFDIHGFTPVCLALMVIHFYQVGCCLEFPYRKMSQQPCSRFAWVYRFCNPLPPSAVMNLILIHPPI